MFILKKVDSDCFVKQINHVSDINFNSYLDIQYTTDMSQIKAKYKTKTEVKEALENLSQLNWHNAEYEIIDLRKHK